MTELVTWAIGLLTLLVATLGGLLARANSKRNEETYRASREKRRADAAEVRVQHYQAAEEASRQSKQEGDSRVQKAVDRARSGDRSHFE